MRTCDNPDCQCESRSTVREEAWEIKEKRGWLEEVLDFARLAGRDMPRHPLVDGLICLCNYCWGLISNFISKVVILVKAKTMPEGSCFVRVCNLVELFFYGRN